MRASVTAGLFVALLSATAFAQPKKDPTPPPTPKVDCELYEVSLSTTKTPPAADPALKPLEKKLSNPPFSTWNTQTLISHTTKALEKNTPTDFPVKIGKTQVVFQQITGKSVVQMTIQVDDSKGKRVLNTQISIAGADFFMTTRQEANKTQHLLALTCK